MIGLLLWKDPQGGKRQKHMTLRESSVLRMRCMRAEILRSRRTPEIVLRRRVLSAVKRLRKLGVSRIVLPENWIDVDLPEEMQPVSTVALRQALAADWVQKELAGKGLNSAGARVAVTASRLTGEMVRTVTELSLRQRYVLVDLSYGGEELCRRLRREYGVSLLMNPDKAQLEGAEVLVLFDERNDLKRKNPVVIPLYDESATLPALVLPPALEEKIPEGVNRPQMLAALLQSGMIRPGVDLTF